MVLSNDSKVQGSSGVRSSTNKASKTITSTGMKTATAKMTSTINTPTSTRTSMISKTNSTAKTKSTSTKTTSTNSNSTGKTTSTRHAPLKSPTIKAPLSKGVPSTTGKTHSERNDSRENPSSNKVKPIGSHARISKSRFDDKKASNPFETKKKSYKTSFSSLYDNNAIPCRIFHATSQMRLQWDKPLDQIPYNPLFIHFAEGLRETIHPYCTIAQAAFKEMCEAEYAQQQILPILDQTILQIRSALMDPNAKVFLATLDAIGQLSHVVGDALDPYLDKILIQVGKRSFQKAYTTKITQLLNQLEEMSGKPEITRLIKSKIPTYQSILF